MKFAIVSLFTLVLVLGVQSSVIPFGGVVTQIAGGHLGHTAVLPHGLPWAGTVVVGDPAAAIHAGIALHGAIPTAIQHAAISAHAPAIIHAGIPAVVAGQAGYVAKTRGAVHSAPLAGHLNSVANVNVAPAPGTI